MKVCIMCGGEGTRLRPLTFERPKPCIPIANTPSISHLVAHLSNLGFHEVIVTLGYLAQEVESVLGDGSLFGVHIRYVHEKEKLGTAGSVKNAQRYLEDQPFLVVGGDHVTDLNLLEFYRQHLQSDAMVSIGLVSIDDPSEYGIAEIDVENRIRRFLEKPAPGEVFSNLASTGMYVCNPEIFDHIPASGKFDFARNLFPFLMERGENLNGWLARGHWTDVGSPRSLRQAERWMLQMLGHSTIAGEVTIRGATIIGPVHLGSPLTIGRGSRIIGPVVIEGGTTIGERVLIGPYTSIAGGCEIGSGTRILSSSLYRDVQMGDECRVSGSIIDSGTITGEGCSLEHNTVIGPRVVLEDGVTVHAGTRIWPELRIPRGGAVKEYCLNPNYDVKRDGS
ncbi:MAG: NDP-sugar synthase [Methanomicrobiales archaeon]|nr:NDP-sugar synthase [Methanomicrobiales archaeon]